MPKNSWAESLPDNFDLGEASVGDLVIGSRKRRSDYDQLALIGEPDIFRREFFSGVIKLIVGGECEHPSVGVIGNVELINTKTGVHTAGFEDITFIQGSDDVSVSYTLDELAEDQLHALINK